MTFQPPSGPPPGPPSSPPAWPGPEASPPPPDRSRRWRVPQGLVIGLSALLGAVVVLAALVLLDDDQDDLAAQAPASTTPVPTAPDPQPLPPPTLPEPAPAPPPSAPEVAPIACPSDVPAPVCEAAQFVQQETGRAFRTFPVVELLDDQAFRDRLLAERDEQDVAEVELVGRLMQAVGLIEPDVDLGRVIEDLLSVAVLGLYVPEDDSLLVRGAEFTPLSRLTIVHELVHALDDQWFDLSRLDGDDVESEAAFGFAALAEGHARVVELAYRDTLPPAQQQEASREEMRMLFESDIDLTSIPPVLLEQLSAPYVLGERLVRDIVERGGTEAVAQAFAQPPTTSEQVMHPEKYATGEEAIPVPPPPADGEVTDEEVMGELGLDYWLGQEGVARGWGGDRYVAWDEGEVACVRADVVMDTEQDLARLQAAFQDWAAEGDRRRVEPLDVAGRPGVRVTSCAG